MPDLAHITLDADALGRALKQMTGPDEYLTLSSEGWRRVRAVELGRDPRWSQLLARAERRVGRERITVLSTGRRLTDVVALAPSPVGAPAFVPGELKSKPAPDGAWYQCNRCEGTGVASRLAACLCTYGVPGSVQLDPEDPVGRSELAGRSDLECESCDGTGISARCCFPCAGHGWFQSVVTFQLLTPAGVLETELHFGLLLPYFGRLAGKRSIDFEAFLRELLAPVCPVTGPLVVSGEDPGSACTVTGRWGIIELGDVSLAQWFGGEFGLLEEPGPHELVIEPMPTFASLLAELIAACKDGCVGFAREELATGEEGIVVWACEEDGTRRAELGLDWTCVDAIVSAVDLLTRGEVPPAIR